MTLCARKQYRPKRTTDLKLDLPKACDGASEILRAYWRRGGKKQLNKIITRRSHDTVRAKAV